MSSLPPSEEPIPKVSRHQKPDGLSLEDWQVALRKSFARQAHFERTNIGQHPIFSEFHVHNPKSDNTYRVAVRGTDLGVNYCSCPDFATNHLGTCKHIEWTLVDLEKEHGSETLLEPYTPPFSEVYLQYGAQRLVRFQIGSECPFELVEASHDYFDERGVLRPAAYRTVDTFLDQGRESDHEFRCYEDTLDFIVQVRDQDRRDRVIARAIPEGIDDAVFESLLRGELYRYQREGALFAARAGRCLIGDEMGLGKTIEALAAAELMARFFGVQSVLIVCPTSLKHQWEREIRRFTNRSVLVAEGTAEKRAQLYREESFFKITNYDVVHRDLDEIDDLSPELVILDEAQRIKNWETRTAQNVKKINSPYAIVLTGTPLENRLEELVSIVQFIDQHRLGPTYRFLHEHQRRDGTGRVTGYRNLDQVSETLSPILIRRRKEQVLDQLPARLEKQFFVPMTPRQQKLHDEQRDIVSKIASRWRRMGGSLPEVDQRKLLVALNAMRMVCDSTYLLDQQTDDSVKPDELITVLEELLEQPDTKVVVFSEWVRMLKLVADRLDRKEWSFALFHGGLNSKERESLLDRFQNDPDCRIFLSSDAGGVGLNLQVASVVVNLDLPWNPAKLEQRIGRVHRIGQARPVQVINFVSEGSVESGMLSVLASKQALSDGVLDRGEADLFVQPKHLGSFMRTVQQVTENISEPLITTPVIPFSADKPTQRPTPQTSNSLTTFLSQGLQLLKDVIDTATDGEAPPNADWLDTATDRETGERYLRIKLPDAHTLRDASRSLADLVESFESNRE